MTAKTSIIIGAIVMTLLTSTVAAVFGGNENEDEIESPELIQAKQEHSFSFSLADDNCVSVDCVKEKMQTFCEKDLAERPVFINCYHILRCLDFSEMTQTTCASGGDSYTSQSLRLTWVVLEGCATQECIMKCQLEPLPAPPECARGVLL